MSGCGVQMPFGCTPADVGIGGGTCLAEEDIATIREWIQEGAPGP
jgi:hypothetical protein